MSAKRFKSFAALTEETFQLSASISDLQNVDLSNRAKLKPTFVLHWKYLNFHFSATFITQIYPWDLWHFATLVHLYILYKSKNNKSQCQTDHIMPKQHSSSRRVRVLNKICQAFLQITQILKDLMPDLKSA